MLFDKKKLLWIWLISVVRYVHHMRNSLVIPCWVWLFCFYKFIFRLNWVDYWNSESPLNMSFFRPPWPVIKIFDFLLLPSSKALEPYALYSETVIASLYRPHRGSWMILIQGARRVSSYSQVKQYVWFLIIIKEHICSSFYLLWLLKLVLSFVGLHYFCCRKFQIGVSASPASLVLNLSKFGVI